MQDGRLRNLSLAIAILAAACWPVAARAVEHAVVVLDRLSPLAARDQIVGRLPSPLARREYERVVAREGLRVRDQDIVAGQERYDVFVPDVDDGAELGLLVFVSPWDGFRLPSGWGGVLDRERLVLVVARGSGNDQDTMARRVPLALHGYALATGRYRIDPRRIYVAGFSDGGRVAQLVAFGYPDVFRGVLMFGGSDPLGEGIAPPPRELMSQVQERLRVVQSTGLDDAANLAIDRRARRSMAQVCIRNLAVVDQPRLGHALPGATGFAHALAALQAPVDDAPPDAQCRERLRQRIDAALAGVDVLFADGRPADAKAALARLDAEYGWLAAPGSVEAMARLETPAPAEPKP